MYTIDRFDRLTAHYGIERVPPNHEGCDILDTFADIKTKGGEQPGINHVYQPVNQVGTRLSMHEARAFGLFANVRPTYPDWSKNLHFWLGSDAHHPDCNCCT